jgi:hypothetical protein
MAETLRGLIAIAARGSLNAGEPPANCFRASGEQGFLQRRGRRAVVDAQKHRRYGIISKTVPHPSAPAQPDPPPPKAVVP